MKNVKNILIKMLKNNTVMFTVYLMAVEILFKLLTNTFSINYTLLRIFISSCILSTLLNIGVSFIKNKNIQKLIWILLTLLVGIYALAQLGFNNFLGNYVSLNTSSQLGKVTSYIKDYLYSFKTVYYTMLIPVVLYIPYILFVKEKSKILKIRYSSLVFILLIGIYIPTITLEFMQNKFQYVSNKVLFKNPALPNVAINQFGISMYGILDVKSKVTGEPSDLSEVAQLEESTEREINDEKINEIIENETDATMNSLNKYFYSRDITEKNDYTGMFEGKNLILIMLESTNNLMINEEYFPTLYKLYNEGISFDNNFSPRNNCSTGNNEFSALTSLYTINNVCSANIYKDNTYFESIFNLFSNKDYEVSSFHNYTEKYYYRKTIHANLGSTYYGVDDLEIPYSNAYKEWPSDVELIEESFKRIDHSKPYMTLLTTVTTHQPYGVSSTYGDKHLDKFKDLKVSKSVKRYLSKMTELDLALERLLELLEEEGELEETVIVMFGDHYPYGIKTEELQKMFDYDLEENMEIERTPFIIYNSEIESKKVDTYTTYINITPTLANLFNLDYDPRLYLGEDLFSENISDIAIFADGSWENEYAYYDAEASKINYKTEDFTYTDEEIYNINKDINQKISMSNLAIVKNYFNYLDNKLNKTDEDSTREEDDKTSGVTSSEN